MRFGLITLLFLSLIVSPAMRAGERVDTSAKAIATLLLEFVHVATPEQRIVLRRVIDDPATTAASRALARGVLRIVHVPHPEDLPALRALMADSSQPRLVRTLARVILHLVHVPTGAQRDAVREALLFNSSRGNEGSSHRETSYGRPAISGLASRFPLTPCANCFLSFAPDASLAAESACRSLPSPRISSSHLDCRRRMVRSCGRSNEMVPLT